MAAEDGTEAGQKVDSFSLMYCVVKVVAVSLI